MWDVLSGSKSYNELAGSISYELAESSSGELAGSSNGELVGSSSGELAGPNSGELEGSISYDELFMFVIRSIALTTSVVTQIAMGYYIFV